jgi:hypothetical protein
MKYRYQKISDYPMLVDEEKDWQYQSVMMRNMRINTHQKLLQGGLSEQVFVNKESILS